jgi:hypothetical protein
MYIALYILIVFHIFCCLLLGNFPPPTTPDEVGARVLMQERTDKVGNSISSKQDQ